MAKRKKSKTSRMQRAISAFMEDQGLDPNTPYVATAGSAMYAHGLRDKFTDVDLYVPGLKNTIEKYYHGIPVDAHGEFFDKDFARRTMKSRQKVNGVWS